MPKDPQKKTLTLRTLHYFLEGHPRPPGTVRGAHLVHRRLLRPALLRQPLRDEPDRRPGKRRFGGPRRGVPGVRPLHPGADFDQRRGPVLLEAAGLHCLAPANRGELRPGHHGLRCAGKPVHDLPFQPIRRHAGQPNLQIHGCLHPADERHHLPVSAGAVLGGVHLRAAVSGGAGVRGGADGAAGGLRGYLLRDVQAHPAPERESGRRQNQLSANCPMR